MDSLPFYEASSLPVLSAFCAGPNLHGPYVSAPVCVCIAIDSRIGYQGSPIEAMVSGPTGNERGNAEERVLFCVATRAG